MKFLFATLTTRIFLVVRQIAVYKVAGLSIVGDCGIVKSLRVRSKKYQRRTISW